MIKHKIKDSNKIKPSAGISKNNKIIKKQLDHTLQALNGLLDQSSEAAQLAKTV